MLGNSLCIPSEISGDERQFLPFLQAEAKHRDS